MSPKPKAADLLATFGFTDLELISALRLECARIQNTLNRHADTYPLPDDVQVACLGALASLRAVKI